MLASAGSMATSEAAVQPEGLAEKDGDTSEPGEKSSS